MSEVTQIGGGNAPTRRVAIVGGGAGGALAAVHLLRSAPLAQRLEVELIDRDGQFGPGVAYGTDDPLHLLNVPAVRMGAIAGHPEHFHEWLCARGGGEQAGSFVSRGVYGEYLRDLLAKAEQFSSERRLLRRRGEVVEISERPGPGRLRLGFAGGAVSEADAVVLAPGPLAGGDPVVIPPRLRESGAYVGDPWRSGALDGVESDEEVLIVGTGLTMVDIALGLCHGDRGPRIRAISRNGLLPRPHRERLTNLESFPVPVESGDLDLIVAAVFRQICRVAHRGDDWRDVIDSMRPDTPAIWRSLPTAEKRRFFAELNRTWEVHRFRMAPVIAARLDALRESGRVEVCAASIAAIQPREDGRVDVALRLPGQTVSERIAVDRVINCAGAGKRIDRDAPAVIRSLLDAGLARPDELGLGLDVTPNGALLDRFGHASPRLFLAGSLRKGVELEAIGITEIRDHAATIADEVLAPRREWAAA